MQNVKYNFVSKAGGFRKPRTRKPEAEQPEALHQNLSSMIVYDRLIQPRIFRRLGRAVASEAERLEAAPESAGFSFGQGAGLPAFWT